MSEPHRVKRAIQVLWSVVFILYVMAAVGPTLSEMAWFESYGFFYSHAANMLLVVATVVAGHWILPRHD